MSCVESRENQFQNSGYTSFCYFWKKKKKKFTCDLCVYFKISKRKHTYPRKQTLPQNTSSFIFRFVASLVNMSLRIMMVDMFSPRKSALPFLRDFNEQLRTSKNWFFYVAYNLTCICIWELFRWRMRRMSKQLHSRECEASRAHLAMPLRATRASIVTKNECKKKKKTLILVRSN